MTTFYKHFDREEYIETFSKKGEVHINTLIGCRKSEEIKRGDSKEGNVVIKEEIIHMTSVNEAPGIFGHKYPNRGTLINVKQTDKNNNIIITINNSKGIHHNIMPDVYIFCCSELGKNIGYGDFCLRISDGEKFVKIIEEEMISKKLVTKMLGFKKCVYSGHEFDYEKDTALYNENYYWLKDRHSFSTDEEWRAVFEPVGSINCINIICPEIIKLIERIR